MTYQELLLITIRGLGQGAIFAMIAMAFNIVGNSSGVLNFASGVLVTLGGILAYLLLPANVSFGMWLVIGAATAAALGLIVAAQGWLTLLPLRSSVEQHSWLVTTMAVSIIISALIHILGGSLTFSVPAAMPDLIVDGTSVPAAYLVAMVAALLCFAAVEAFYRYRLTGLAMSALAQDIDAARSNGIRVRRIQVIAFLLSGLILGTAGFVGAPVFSLSAETGMGFLLSGFTAAVVGGMGSNIGALVGGALVGMTSMLAAYLFGGLFQDAASLGALVIVLMIRPEGIFGLAAARRV
ncbi:branched-chain amino acid ABC transporter permease [soil metagenome]